MKTRWKIRRLSSSLFPSPWFLLCCPLSFTFCSVFPLVSFASLFLMSNALSFFFVFVCSRGGATRDKAGACALAGQRFSLFLSSPVPLFFFFCVLPLFISVRSRFSPSFFSSPSFLPFFPSFSFPCSWLFLLPGFSPGSALALPFSSSFPPCSWLFSLASSVSLRRNRGMQVCFSFFVPCAHPFSGFYSRRMASVSLGNEDSGLLLQE